MKKITLLGLLGMFLIGNTMMAQLDHRRGGFNFDDPIVFVERGIEFYVFLDGTFDFNTRPFDSQGGVFFRRGQQINGTNFGNYGVVISTDSFGRIRSVGNVFINYDRFNRVTRIGTVFLGYNRHSLNRVGGMIIHYNRRGQIVSMFGRVNRGATVNTNTYYGPSRGIVSGGASGIYYRQTE